jgi:hypothetical protein
VARLLDKNCLRSKYFRVAFTVKNLELK